ncbi:MAG: hypothetical protein AAF170_03600 [Bacteroidota bacterium]
MSESPPPVPVLVDVELPEDTDGEQETPPESRWTVARLARYSGHLGVELLIVFIGVYAAFMLGRYQEGQKDEARRGAIYQALLAEVDRTAADVAEHREVLVSGWVEPIVESYERGEKPYIYGLWLPTRPPSGAWDSMLASGIDLLDPALIQAVEGHRSDLQFMLDQADRAVRLSDEQITPNMGDQDFYQGESAQLRAQYQWYPQLLGYLVGNADKAAASSDSLRAEIQRRIADS